MAAPNGSLENFLNKYIGNRERENRAMSLAEYTESLGKSPNDGYLAALTGALNRRRTSDTDYGETAERLRDSGLAGGGYEEFLTRRADEQLELDRDSALGAKLREEAEIDAGYAKYLKSFRDKEISRANRIRQQLLSNEVVNPDTSYAIAVNAGLSADDAAAVSAEVYSIMRDRIFTGCLERVATLELDAEGAREYAIRMGLTEADADALASEARDYLKYYKDYAGSYMDYLEDKSDTPR